MRERYKTVLRQIRDAYARMQAGELEPSILKREGASSYECNKRERVVSKALVLCDPSWSTGSMARDIAATIPTWGFELADWSRSHDWSDVVKRFDAIVCMTLTCAGRIPALRDAPNAVHLLLHPNELKLPEVQALLTQKLKSNLIGAVSGECLSLATAAFPRARVMLAPVSARRGRFRPRPRTSGRNPLRAGFVGFPQAESVQVTGDTKRPGMFLDICAAAGADPVFSGKLFTYETMSAFYKEIDVLICASSVDGGPMPPFEAIACGVPMISTPVGNILDSGMPGTFDTVEEAAKLLMGDLEALYLEQAKVLLTWNWETLGPAYWEPLLTAVLKNGVQ